MQQRTTLIDIAKAAGVCKATVVKVLSGGDTNIRVRPETARRIREAAERLHYRPNLNARALTGRKTQVIGVFIDSMAAASGWQTLAGIEQFAAGRQYRVMVAVAHDNVEELAESYQVFKQYSVDGVITMAHDYPGESERIRKYFGNEEDKIVFVDRPVVPNAVSVSYADCAVTIALDHFNAGGRTRSGIITEDSPYPSSRTRLQQFRRRIVDPRRIYLMPPVDKLSDAETHRHLQQAVEILIKREQLDSVIVASNLWAMDLLPLLNDAGVSVPGQLAVVGWGKERFCRLTRPALSTIELDHTRAGHDAARLLLDWIQTGERPASVEIMPQLVERGSACFARLPESAAETD